MTRGLNGSRSKEDGGSKTVVSSEGSGEVSCQFLIPCPDGKIQIETGLRTCFYILLPTANCQLPTANCQLPTANCQLPTDNCQLTTDNCLPYRLSGISIAAIA